jgi:hypothetical protein
MLHYFIQVVALIALISVALVVPLTAVGLGVQALVRVHRLRQAPRGVWLQPATGDGPPRG